MLTEDKTRAAMNGPYSVDENREDSRAIAALQALREEAFYLAGKYRFDPALGLVHMQYLNKLNLILGAI